jgi:hypothetical protein
LWNYWTRILIWFVLLYIYIHTERERQRERARGDELGVSSSSIGAWNFLKFYIFWNSFIRFLEFFKFFFNGR